MLPQPVTKSKLTSRNTQVLRFQRRISHKLSGNAESLIDNDGNGCLTFEVSKGRFGFKLTAPYDEKRRKAASELAKKNTERLRRQEQ